MCASAVSNTQARSQIVGISHAVQYQNQGLGALLGRQFGIGGFQVFQQFIQ